jgi:hypothetical protein
MAPDAADRKIFIKNLLFPVDGAQGRAIFAIPLETGPEGFRGGSRTFGTANWNSILSRHDARLIRQSGGEWIIVGARIEFFDAPKDAQQPLVL